MIRFNHLEEQKEIFRLNYLTAKPFPHLVIDDICEGDKIEKLYEELPELETKSRDYVFANNKFEKSKISDISKEFNELYNDLLSDRFRDFLSYISNEKIFIDEQFHGGGIHQGKENSFLDMHLDFNYHPLHPNWFRNLNLLLYMNKDWKEEYGGQLKLEDLRTGEKKEISVPFNRLVIQQTRGYTLHGYDMTSFPKGKYRTSIAAYGYSVHSHIVESPRTTDWFVKDNASTYKKIFAKYSKPLVKVKNTLLGSATARNHA